VPNYDAIIIGAGHNGLVTAAYLAKAGKKVLVLERRAIPGGIAATEEIFPGFKFSTCAHLAGSFAPEIIAALDLEKHGLEILPLDPLLFAPSLEGNALVIPAAPTETDEEIGRHSKNDGQKFASFSSLLKRLSGFLLTLYTLPLPDRAGGGNSAPLGWIKAAWKFHRLSEKERYEFLRVLPMSAADLLDEWFEHDLLKATLAASGLLGSFVGPRQQGTAFNLLHHQLGASNGAFRTAGFIRGGAGNLSQALAQAGLQRGIEIRTESPVSNIVTKNGVATGVGLENGAEIGASVVISNADVKRTFLNLVEPTYLDPHFLLQVRNIRSRGTVAKINLALDALPQFKSAANRKGATLLGGIIHIGPTLDYLEHASDNAKYGRFSKQPFLEITIPTIADPSLAPAGKHVMSIWMQYAPYYLKEANWNEQREALGDAVVKLIEAYAPGFENSILHRQILTPLDLERIYSLTEGHLYHAEMALDQIFFMRPIPGWSRYRTPVKNLYLCGSGTHPGGGLTGWPGYFAAREILKSWPRGR
jgi:phytoene dehydrogenase-like protein